MKFGRRNFKPIGYVDTSLGKLAVFTISYGDQTKVLGETSRSVERMKPLDLAQRLIPYIAHRTDALGEEEGKPDAPSLTMEEVNSLSPDEIESILDLFIKDQEHLYRKLESNPSKNEEGKQVLSMTYGEIEHPRKEGESNVDYLHRLYVLEREELKRQMEKMLGPSLRAAHFSAGLAESIKKTLLMGDSMSKALEAMRPSAVFDSEKLKPRSIEMTPALPSVDYGALAKDAEKARWAPFNAVNERLDVLAELTAKSSEFMVQMNQTQTTIASEIKASGEEASKIGRESLKVTRWGYYVTIAVFVLTFAGFVYSIIDRIQARDDVKESQRQTENLTNGLNDLGNAVESEQKATSDEIKALLSQIEHNRVTQDKQVHAILAGQAELLRQQANDRLQDQKTIEELRRKLSELEARIEGREPQTQPVEGGK